MFKSIENFAAFLGDRAETRPLPPLPVTPKLPEIDTEDEAAADALGAAEGQSFIIEYIDAAGAASRRPITVWGLSRAADGVVLLQARCHLREADRTFRADRIKACIDFNGEVFDDVPAFLAETFGIPAATAARRSIATDTMQWNAFRASHRPHFIVLAALSRVDGQMAREEVAVIVDYAIEEARQILSTPADAFAGLAARYIARLRPTRDQVVEAVEALADLDTKATVRLLNAAVHVVSSDGIKRAAEMAFINDLGRELANISFY